MFAPRSGRFLGPPAIAGIALFVGAWLAGPGPGRVVLAVLGVGTLALAAFLAQFFRDPERLPGPEVVSAADGRVVAVAEDGARWQVVVFMNVTDVHVNRFPLDATVVSVREGGAGFRAAFRADAAHNVRRHYDLSTSAGPVEVVQLTGAVARRLVSFVHPGDRRSKGDRLGMIVLGSRVDVFLPKERVQVTVREGDRVKAGVSPIARVRA